MSMEDYAKIIAIRAATYMSEQDCPYDEEFDGNDFCSTHLLGYIGGEPAACIRIRYFGEFAKVERLAVRASYRRSRAAAEMVKQALMHCRAKGFTKAYGHAPAHLEKFWARFGFRKTPESRTLRFSDIAYTEMFVELDPVENSVSLKSDPYVILRPEGKWDEQGVLEASASRPEKTFHQSGRAQKDSAKGTAA